MQTQKIHRDSPVIVGEDNFLTARLLSAIFQQAGHAVIVARDGMEVMRLVEKHRPSLLILNMNLARPSSVDVMRMLQIKHRELPIFAITSPGQAVLRSAATGFGVRKIFETPFYPAELADQARLTLTGR